LIGDTASRKRQTVLSRPHGTGRSEKNLYLECLKHYHDTVLRTRLAALSSGVSASEGIRGFFRAILDELDDPKTPRICLFGASLSSDVLAERDLLIAAA